MEVNMVAAEGEILDERDAQGMVIDVADFEVVEDTGKDENISESRKRKETHTDTMIMEAPPLHIPHGQHFKMTVEEMENSLILDAEMPMLNMDSLRMTVDDDTRLLSISGEKNSPARKRARIETNSVLVEEINNQSYLRRVLIPEGYDLNHVSTSYNDGALTIVFKKMAVNTARRTHVIPNSKARVCIVQ